MLAILLGLGLIALGILQTNWFKNYATNRVINHLSSELKVKVQIDEVSIDYFDRLSAKNLIIEDRNQDTLIYIAELTADYDLFTFSKEILNLDKVVINNADVNIGVYDTTNQLNIQFLVDYFNPKDSKTQNEPPKLSFDKIELNSSRFHYFNKVLDPPSTRRFDETDMEYSSIDAVLHDFTIIGDSLNFDIKSLSTKEKCGLYVEDFSSKTIISRQLMSFTDLKFKTNRSEVELDLEFTYSHYKDFGDFIHKVHIASDVASSSIHSQDLAYFHNNLNSINEVIQIHGTASGKVDNLTCTDLNLKLGDQTKYTGKASLEGIPDIENMRFILDADNFESSTQEIVRLIEINGLPSEFTELGHVVFDGEFSGKLDAFLVNGNILTRLGKVTTNLNYSSSGNSTYKGSIAAQEFNLGELLNLPEFGSTSLNLDIDGSGLTLHDLKSKVYGNIDYFDYENYRYKNISLDGEVAENIYIGTFNIVDPNFNFGFSGKLDATSEDAIIKVNTNVNAINLKTLGLDSTNAFVKFHGPIHITASSINDITGVSNLKNFTYSRAGNNYKLKKVKVRTSKDSLSVHSDLGIIALSGSYLNNELGGITDHLISIFNPNELDSLSPLESDSIRLFAQLVEHHPIYKEFLPGFYFDSASLLLSYDYNSNKISSSNFIYSPDYLNTNSKWASVKFKNSGTNTPINFSVNTDGLNNGDSVLFDVLNAHGFANEGIVHFETTSSKDTLLDIILSGRYMYQNDSSIVYLDDSKVEIYGTPWTLKNTEFPNIINHNGITEFFYFDFRYNDEILFLDASLGRHADKLNLSLANFRLKNLMPFFTAYDFMLDGSANGYIDISDRDGYPFIESKFRVENLQLNDDTLGNLDFQSSATDELLVIDVDGKLDSGILNDLSIEGNLDFNNSNSPLNLELTTDSSGIKPFEKYLDGLASNIEGYSTTKINITGPLEAPKLTGTMRIDGLDFVVDYLQTRYSGDALLDISHNAFTINKATVFDQYRSAASVSGKVSHKNFIDYLFDIHIDKLENFEIMKTERKDNELFYGNAFVDGDMHISGPLDDILLEINAKSRKGTEIEIPLDNFETSGKLSYVDFVNLKEDNNALNEAVTNIAGIQMNFNFEVTKDAKVTMVFDELLGDKIEAAGHGNIRMEINTYGDFNMYGGLTIDEGNYLFTAFDLINKYFVVKPGGTLFWDGNPYNATINLSATKREYPVPQILLSGLLSEDELDQYNQAIPVDCHLILKGLLFNPDVAFDLSFPSQIGISTTNNTALTTVIDRIKLDQDELSRQVFALLVLGAFIPPSFANVSAEDYNAGTGVAHTGWNSLSDLASSQLNNWLSQLDTRVQIGLDYQVTDAERDEIILSLRRKFFNDRLELGYSIDAGAAAGTRPYDVNVQYNLSQDGNFKIRGFQKNANDPTLGSINNITTTGVGLFYRYQFDKFRIRRKKKNKQ